jgi:hypothetical protein
LKAKVSDEDFKLLDGLLGVEAFDAVTAVCGWAEDSGAFHVAVQVYRFALYFFGFAGGYWW